MTYANGIGASLSYDSASRLTALVYSRGAGTLAGTLARSRPPGRLSAATAGSDYPSFLYTYDPAGNRTAITDVTGTHSYQFDEVNRLTAATHPTLNAESHSYDAGGNRTASATDRNYTYDRLGRLTKAEGATYAYDANGNLTSKVDSKGTTAYTYDFENRLTGIRLPDGTKAAYLYDALGRRIQKNVDGAVTNYLYDGPDDRVNDCLDRSCRFEQKRDRVDAVSHTGRRRTFVKDVPEMRVAPAAHYFGPVH